MATARVLVNISADMGESLGPWPMGRDPDIAPYLTSAHIACGFHASDPGTIRRSIELQQHKVAIGAHPGYPDLVGFGRRRMDMAPREVEDMVLYQVAALARRGRDLRPAPPACQASRAPRWRCLLRSCVSGEPTPLCPKTSYVTRPSGSWPLALWDARQRPAWHPDWELQRGGIPKLRMEIPDKRLQYGQHDST